MKKIKIGVAIVFAIVTVYFLVSFGIFWIEKPSFDMQQSQLLKEETGEQQNMQSGNQVVIQRGINNNDQSLSQSTPTCQQCQQEPPRFPVKLIITQDQDSSLPLIMSDNQFACNQDPFADKELRTADSYSFITMPISDDYKIDEETQASLDTLIGPNLDEFVRLVLQSNNNIVSQEACRSCGMYAFFHGIKKHHQLKPDEIVILQQVLENLYQFVVKMKAISKSFIMRSEQYDALLDLHRSQAVKNDMKLQARRAATASALKKLQTIKYNN